MSETITPLCKNLWERGALDQEHGLSNMTNTIYKGINSKEAAIAALTAEMDTNLKDIRLLRGLVEKENSFKLVEGTKEYNQFNEIIRRLKAQGHDIDIATLGTKAEKNGKTVLIFNRSQKKELKEKLEGMEELTKQSQEENKTKLQKITQEEKDLWNLVSNLIKIYYDQMKSILTDTSV